MTIARIEFNEPTQDGLVRTQGTRVFVGDEELDHVTKIEIVGEPNNIWRATIHCIVRLPKDLVVDADFLMRAHPDE